MRKLGFALISLSFICAGYGYISGEIPSFEPGSLKMDIQSDKEHLNHILFLKMRLTENFSAVLKYTIERFVFEGLNAYKMRLHTIWALANCACISKFIIKRLACPNQLPDAKDDLLNHCHRLGAKFTTAFSYHFVTWQEGVIFQKLNNRPVFLNLTVEQHLYINCTFTTLCLPKYAKTHYTNKLSIDFPDVSYTNRYKHFSFKGCYATPITIFTSTNWMKISSLFDYAVDTTLFNWELTYQTLKTLITQNFMTRILHLTDSVFAFDIFNFPTVAQSNKVFKQWHFKSLPFESACIHFMDITGSRTTVKVYDGPGVKSPMVFHMENSYVLIGSKKLKTSNQFLIEMAADISDMSSIRIFKANISTKIAKFDPTVCHFENLKPKLVDSFHFEIGVRNIHRDRNVQCFFPVRDMIEKTKAILVSIRIEHVHYKGPNTLFVNQNSHFRSLRGEDHVCDYGGFSMIENIDITRQMGGNNPVGKFYICSEMNQVYESSWHSNESIHQNLVFNFNSYKAYSQGTFKAIVFIKPLEDSWLNQLDFFGTKGDPGGYHLSTNTQTFVSQLIRHHIYPNAQPILIAKTSRYDFFGPTEIRLLMMDCLTKIQCIEKERRNCSSTINVRINTERVKKLQLRYHEERHFLQWTNEINIFDESCPTDVLSYVVIELKKFGLAQTNMSIRNEGHAYMVLLYPHLFEPFGIMFYETNIEYIQSMWSFFYITKEHVGTVYPFMVSISPIEQSDICVLRGLEVTENSENFKNR